MIMINCMNRKAKQKSYLQTFYVSSAMHQHKKREIHDDKVMYVGCRHRHNPPGI